ncbi:MAG TPA: hypothetical protein PK863_06405 [Candidatus Dojkabacteria bacterium]|nr:hypothetical protein [Candidatus Dojkabacteria bacterium]
MKYLYLVSKEMLSKIFGFFLFIILVLLEVSLLVTDYWWVANINLLIIAGTIKLTKGSQTGGLFFILIGTIIVDLLMFRNITLIAMFYTSSILITRFISRSLKIIGLPGSSTHSFVVFLIFLIINNTYLYIINVLNITQIIFVTISSLLILVGSLLITSVKRKSRNAFKI